MSGVTIQRESTSSPYAEDLRLAHVIVDQVDAVTSERFRSRDFKVTEKNDLSPVTDADLVAEEIVRGQLSRARARDTVVGEELGTTTAGNGSRQWIVDPIDGTKNFVRGVPVWGTLLALVVDDHPVVGLVSAPALGKRWWAAQGGGAYTGRSLSRATRLSVSTVRHLRDASLSLSDLSAWEKHDRLDAMVELTRRVCRSRGYGDFWSYMMVAEGAVDVAAEPELEVHDMAALVPIVEEAGGKFTSLDGASGPWHRSAVATNSLLHDPVLQVLSHRSM